MGSGLDLTRLRNCRVGGFGLHHLVGLLFVLLGCYYFLSYHKQQRPQAELMNYLNKLNQMKLQSYLELMPDTRSKICLKRAASSSAHEVAAKATIIITFRDHQFYELEMVMKSLYSRTPTDLVDEFIIIDDGTKAKYINKDLQKFAKVYPKVHIMRTNATVGTGPARLIAAKRSRSPILVFVDTTTIVNVGWLPPLMKQVLRNPRSIAVPHADSIIDANTYPLVATSRSVSHVFTWGMAVVKYKDDNPIKSKKTILPSAVMRGNAYAVDRSFFFSLGAYDRNIGVGGGEDLELSFRAWLCGGGIQTVLCSRVGVIGLDQPIRITHLENYNLISRLWLSGEKYQKLMYPNSDTLAKRARLPYHRGGLPIIAREKYIRRKNCKSFDWYLQSVAKMVEIPSSDFISYGLLRTRSGLCAQPGLLSIKLGSCNVKEYNRGLFFTLHKNGWMTNGRLCLSITRNYYTAMEKCIEGKKDQVWELKPNGNLKLRTSAECAMHVTDPNPKHGQNNQIIMIQACSKNDHQFQSWTFEADAGD